MMPIRTFILLTALCSAPFAVAIAQGNPERHESTEALGATTESFSMEGGEEIYMVACAGCHQPQGQGAVGAGQYPALSANPRLEGGRYPAWIVVNGMGAMPPFDDWLDDAQIVEVVAYIQENLGNGYESSLSAEDVAALRDAPAP